MESCSITADDYASQVWWRTRPFVSSQGAFPTVGGHVLCWASADAVSPGAAFAVGLRGPRDCAARWHGAAELRHGLAHARERGAHAPVISAAVRGVLNSCWIYQITCFKCVMYVWVRERELLNA